MNNDSSITYQNILCEIRRNYCKKDLFCKDCPYANICLGNYNNSDSGREAFKTAILERYKELKEKEI
jgi:hypothetical protein